MAFACIHWTSKSGRVNFLDLSLVERGDVIGSLGLVYKWGHGRVETIVGSRIPEYLNFSAKVLSHIFFILNFNAGLIGVSLACKLSKKFLLDLEKYTFVFQTLNGKWIFDIDVVNLIVSWLKSLSLIEHLVDCAFRLYCLAFPHTQMLTRCANLWQIILVVSCQNILNLLLFWPDWIRSMPLFEHHGLLLQMLSLWDQMHIEAGVVVLVL